MSRSNAKVAHLLREADTIRTNKAVLKAGRLAQTGDVFEVLGESSSKYEDKMASLLKFNARSKKSVKVTTHKTEWVDEQLRLQNLANKLELSVGSILDTAVAQMPDDEALLEVVDISAGYYNARKKNQAEISGQLHNIKEMLKETTKRSGGQRNRAEQDQPDSNMSATQAIIAELFIKLRTDQAKVWQYWLTQERELRHGVAISAGLLASALRNDTILVQDAALREEFVAILTQNNEPEDVPSSGSVKRSLHSVSMGSPRSPSKGHAGHDDQSTLTAQHERLQADLEIVMDEWLHKIALLDKAQELRVIEKETERALVNQEMGVHSMGHAGEGRLQGGWTDADHDMFVKVYRKAQVTGMARKQLLQILGAELPGHDQEAIVQHEEWYRKMKFISHRFKESEAAYVTARAELVAQAKVALQEHRVQTLEALAREREAEMHEKHRSEIHDRLQLLWAEKEAVDSEQRAEREKQEAALRVRLAEQEEAIRQERLEKKQQVDRFREAREVEEAEAQRRHEAKVQEAREAVRRLVEQNRPNVQRREQLLEEKEDRRKQKEMELELEEMRRIELLNKLASQVPYFDAIQDATSKLDHITASAKGHEYIACDDPQIRGHLPLNGFTDNRVIQDSRFRLAEALRKSGVAGSQAARAVVAQFYPRPHLAIHGII